MEENKFFKFVWRFNGVVFMITAVLAIGVLSFAGYRMYQEVTRERATRNIVNVAEDSPIKETWQLGHLQNISGTSYVIIPLYSDQNYAQSYFSKSAQSTRNVLFINIKTNQKKWLFDTNNYLIINEEHLSEKEFDHRDRNIRAILYSVVKKDTNGDKRLTNDDKIDVALTTPSGDNYKELLNGIDHLVGYRLLDKDTMFMVFQKQGIGYSASV
jgi:heme/copper-type cytochrome/quinol oxidase subunit 2